MNYKSNLEQYDLTPLFRHVYERPQGQSFGHDVPSDWADKTDDDPVFGIWKQCGSFTRDEAAILAACARQYLGYPWLDIGCNTGMVSKLINWMTNAPVTCVDYMLGHPEFYQRFLDNTGFPRQWIRAEKSDAFFEGGGFREFAGVVIDGDHDRPQPMKDAMSAALFTAPDGVIVFHDFIGQPVRDAVAWLMNHGFKARVYFTPHMVAACWRGSRFVPPNHVPDPALPDLKARCPEFDFGRCV